ncbi:Hypothetical predicted protein [Pelobates cultripes]|uniref:L1 transposable element RRM domain-containing protein n=1 Tax=Pelobates cultripes TaxID=61616 RepID=A0AAD1SFS6_PELCU|nr:Hypothetical predicted protein [Pelobates cultripes]
MNIYFSPQQHKTLKQKLNDIDTSNDTLDQEEIKVSDKDQVTSSILHNSLRANLDAIKLELATTATEIKLEIKQEINILAANMQRFEDQFKEMDYQVKSLTDETQKAHSKIWALELKLMEMEDRSRRKKLRFRNIPEKHTKEDIRQTLLDFFVALGITFDPHDQIIESCHRLLKPQAIKKDVPRDIIACFLSYQVK